MSDIKIFTDGSSRGNPGRGGWGAIVSFSDNIKEIGGREEHTTNNRMELQAALEALLFVETQKISDSEIVIYTDSSYLINGITKWVKGWVKNDWKTADKKPVLNKDIWQKLIDIVETLEEKSEIKWVYLKGHVGIPGNERVDEIATAFADNNHIELFAGPKKKYKIDLNSISPSKR